MAYACGMNSGYGLIWATLAVALFSLIFWGTYMVLVKDKRSRK
jgi:hypothetical protein